MAVWVRIQHCHEVSDASYRFAEILQSVFAPMRVGLTKPQFLHLRCFVLAVVMRGRSEMRAVAQASTFGRHRTSVGLFLCHAEWDEVRCSRRRAVACCNR